MAVVQNYNKMRNILYTTFGLGTSLVFSLTGCNCGNDDYVAPNPSKYVVEKEIEPILETPANLQETLGDKFTLETVCFTRRSPGLTTEHGQCYGYGLDGTGSNQMQIKDMDNDGDKDIVVLSRDGDLLIFYNEVLSVETLKEVPQ